MPCSQWGKHPGHSPEVQLPEGPVGWVVSGSANQSRPLATASSLSGVGFGFSMAHSHGRGRAVLSASL
jgi:hypothetical protein